MLEALAQYVFYPLGILGLLSIPLIIIIYFLKRKVTITRLPTVMFLFKQQSRKRYRWFPRIPFNVLLFVYLLLAIVATMILMNPFIDTELANTKEHAVHVIDTSASMSTASRFVSAIETAKNNLAAKNTIIVTSPKPFVILDEGSAYQARTILSNLQPTQSRTPLISSIDFVKQKNFHDIALHVYSDYAETESQGDIQTQMASVQDAVVVPHLFSEGKNSLGIISADVKKNKVTLLIRNFEDAKKITTISANAQQTSLELAPNDVASITFTATDKPVEITLEPFDDMPADNYFYLAPITAIEKKLLYISNNPYRYTKLMLDVIDFISYEEYAPPGALTTQEYDAFVIEDVNIDNLLPSNINDALYKVSQGGVLIIKMGDKMRDFPIRDEFPYESISAKKRSQLSFSENPLVEGLTTSANEEVYPVQIKPDTKVLMQTEENEPVVVMRGHGAGVILYYGIHDPAVGSSFKETYAYPILFQRVLKESYQIPSLAQQQLQTTQQWLGRGTVVSPQKKEIELPTTIAYGGFYNYQSAIYAANLISIDESSSKSINVEEISNLSSHRKVPMSIVRYFIYALIVLLLIEIYLLHKRGEQ